ncbi:hypothetical protein SADUNF_Sadunf16G0288400 [Salix dunnii]|uniref:Uncharacterized protein n=1 Tax=Salix dunnii TaxID=1413687 RepID=A0A835MID6_9ROSI|nr:hypothetical protein SADUNF_Sadunf16G0288400 [Salix dunnii]
MRISSPDPDKIANAYLERLEHPNIAGTLSFFVSKDRRVALVATRLKGRARAYGNSYETIDNFIVEANCPKLMAYCKRCLQKLRECIHDSQKVYDLVTMLRKMLGLE